MGNKFPVLIDEEGKLQLSSWQDDMLWDMAEGKKIPDIARKLAKGDKKKSKHFRKKLYRMMQQIHIQDELAARWKLMTILGLGPAIKSLNRKAAAGRVDAIKLVFESSGFYNPRIQHEHSGEVQITIRNAPRPERVIEEYARDSEPVVDAEVVE